MKLEELYQTLKNEYLSGKFYIEDNKINWIYSTEGVKSAEEAEDRWLSFLGAKITAENIIEGTNFEIIQKFESNNKIGFSIREKLVKKKQECFYY
ncbi:virion protein [Bacillus phage AR9]|uniref:Virion protein n=2 Tax=Bacillus phage PBS1 TaxID=10683 RepID=A0A172JIG6_BPPB1|nr:virion protein [Bacillus phage AR9]YP_009664346.1 hypothetical protein FK780_gp302 [Bacillus phage PBS1]QXN70174.1 hypothetical protein INTERNEXUS_134 [Bacillus phage vB_BspM_Internexus]WCS68381.1 hypothetical protein Goe21_02720 [Bacillus phage vB_BsuM-Goe21]AMS01336.1 virion protein [Bacillus phage AR9]AST99966.1 hypothetical protein PBI_PBS1_145 [Bacillus phage PBS1]BDE75518.1 hypothetical protein [Bacillus phage PBS1]